MANDGGDNKDKFPRQKAPKEKQSPPADKKPETPRRNSRAGIVWLLILLALGTLALFKGYDTDKVRQLLADLAVKVAELVAVTQEVLDRRHHYDETHPLAAPQKHGVERPGGEIIPAAV